MSKIRSSSLNRSFSSWNSGLRQSSGWRVGASRLPSRELTGSRCVTPRYRKSLRSQRVQRLLEPVGVRALRLRERLEPVGDFFEAFIARLLRHARVHVGVLGRLAGDCRLQVRARRADRQAGRRIADDLEILEMAVRVTGLAFRRRAEHGCNVVESFDVGLRCEVEIATIRLRLASERVLQILFRLRAL